MPFARMLVSWKNLGDPGEDLYSNTLYFNVSGSIDPPDYATLANDLAVIYGARPWTKGRQITVRAYDMADPEPRPPKAIKVQAPIGSIPSYIPQVALCLSYYADRNLPRQRGRIYTGPYGTSNAVGRPTTDQMADLITFGQALAGLGGLNVDWSLWSPTNQQHTRLSRIWVDNSFDVIRSRQLPGTARSGADING